MSDSNMILKLYVAGRTARSERAIANLEATLSASGLEGQCQVEVIDVLERPQIAEEQKIVATPLLVREVPPPLRRLVGDLSATREVVRGLGLRADDDSDNGEREA